MKQFAYAGLGGYDDPTSGKDPAKSNAQSLPQYPGEDSLKHIADKWIEVSKARLAAMDLLDVANGGMTKRSYAIQDEPVLPPLSGSHPLYEKRLEVIHHTQMKNLERQRTRMKIEIQARTELFAAVHTAVAASTTMLAREIHTMCDCTDDKRGIKATALLATKNAAPHNILS